MDKGTPSNSDNSHGIIRRIANSDARRITSMQVYPDVACVVKELIENAIDGGATSVDIQLHGGGLDRIVVKDDGVGIPAESCSLIAQSGCTSKISTYSDLSAVHTYGFRGEALGALCDVADRVEITTRTVTDGEKGGRGYTFSRAGEILAHWNGSAQRTGTEVVVSGLFSPYPVRRRKFIGDRKAQCADVKETILIYALARPDVRFHFKGRNPIDELLKPASASLRDAVRDVFKPRNVLGNLVHVTASSPVPTSENQASKKNHHTSHHLNNGIVSLHGFLPRDRQASMTRGKRYYLFVNTRPVLLRNLRRKIKELYNAALTAAGGTSQPLHPWVILHITTPPSTFDVNMDKAKSELLLSRAAEDTVVNLLETAMQDIYHPTESPASNTNGVIPVNPTTTAVQLSPSAGVSTDFFTVRQQMASSLSPSLSTKWSNPFQTKSTKPHASTTGPPMSPSRPGARKRILREAPSDTSTDSAMDHTLQHGHVSSPVSSDITRGARDRRGTTEQSPPPVFDLLQWSMGRVPVAQGGLSASDSGTRVLVPGDTNHAPTRAPPISPPPAKPSSRALAGNMCSAAASVVSAVSLRQKRPPSPSPPRVCATSSVATRKSKRRVAVAHDPGSDSDSEVEPVGGASGKHVRGSINPHARGYPDVEPMCALYDATAIRNALATGFSYLCTNAEQKQPPPATTEAWPLTLTDDDNIRVFSDDAGLIHVANLQRCFEQSTFEDLCATFSVPMATQHTLTTIPVADVTALSATTLGSNRDGAALLLQWVQHTSSPSGRMHTITDVAVVKNGFVLEVLCADTDNSDGAADQIRVLKRPVPGAIAGYDTPGSRTVVSLLCTIVARRRASQREHRAGSDPTATVRGRRVYRPVPVRRHLKAHAQRLARATTAQGSPARLGVLVDWCVRACAAMAVRGSSPASTHPDALGTNANADVPTSAAAGKDCGAVKVLLCPHKRPVVYAFSIANLQPPVDLPTATTS
eukprot:m.1063708 g.1063708  ORF g.1063708 m.1063708 type:complete len:981 (+) comp24218_c2_seq4:190-3132(+)